MNVWKVGTDVSTAAPTQRAPTLAHAMKGTR
jgi:hypothetical protein